MSLAGIAAGVGAGAQLGTGISGFLRSRDVADAIDDAGDLAVRDRTRAGQRRAGTIRAQFARSGVEIGAGSPLVVLAENAVDTARANQRIIFNFEMRRERALAEGIADLSAGIGAGIGTFLGGLDEVLDIPTDDAPLGPRELDFPLLEPLTFESP